MVSYLVAGLIQEAALTYLRWFANFLYISEIMAGMFLMPFAMFEGGVFLSIVFGVYLIMCCVKLEEHEIKVKLHREKKIRESY